MGVPAKKYMKERRSPRGLVPTATYGRLDTVYQEYLSDIDPGGDSDRSKAIRFALASARDTRFREFIARLGQPSYHTWSLAALAKSCDISLPEWAEFFQKSQTQRALAQAQIALPNLTTDLIKDARRQSQVCARCDGLGSVPCEFGLPDDTPGIDVDEQTGNMKRTCPECRGKGRKKIPGDTDSRKMLLEMTGVIGKRGSPAVSIVQHFGGANIEAAQSRLNAVTFDVTAEPADDAPTEAPVDEIST